jgi:hypothetical protein
MWKGLGVESSATVRVRIKCGSKIKSLIVPTEADFES